MTQPSRTTETINRDNAAIRDIMHQITELTIPDRATLALGLIGHLATMMNRSQMTKLMDQLREEAERVQDVPPIRQREDRSGPASGATGDRADAVRTAAPPDRDGRTRQPPDDRASAARAGRVDPLRTKPHGDVPGGKVEGGERDRYEGVGQAGRGEFRARRPL